MADLDTILRAAPVMPVLVVHDLEDAIPMAEALVEGGLRVLEVTLRTPAALSVIRAMKAVPGSIVGAGTVINPALLDQAVEAGADFAVSPGLTSSLASAAADAPIPLLPGVASASDIMHALDHGFSRLKFFPATAAGGLPALRSLSSVFAGVSFCPTGGITPANAGEWLREPSVACVGGTWIVPPGQPVDRAAITGRAREAAALRSK